MPHRYISPRQVAAVNVLSDKVLTALEGLVLGSDEEGGEGDTSPK